MDMKINSLPPASNRPRYAFTITVFMACVLMLTALSTATLAQGTSQLSLADLLIGLRSKKATLPERNKILSDAVVTRGTTFALTAEIEKELAATGADKVLIDSIRQRSQFVKIAAVSQPATDTKAKTEPPPTAAPAPPDFSFYEKRADAAVAKGDMDAATIDYTKAIEMNPSGVSALVGRASVYYSKSSYTLAIADLTKAIELSPQNAAAYAARGQAHEKKGSQDLATADYKKALELDPANAVAKTAVAAIEAEQAKIQAKREPVPAAPAPVPVLPEFLEMGQLTEAQAIKMGKPMYSPIAYNSNIGGRVVVEVELDKEGNVTSAKVSSGHPFLKQSSEEAARKSKFKPAMVGDKAVKGKGTIIYNFVPKR